MKKIAGLAVVLILVLGGYYAMGLATEQTVKNNVAMINKSNGLHVEIKNYERGWFKSQAILGWVLHVPEEMVYLPNKQTKVVPPKDYAFDMPLTIYHGPIIVADSRVKFGLGYAHADLALPADFVKSFDELFTSESTKPELNLTLFINFLNHTTINFGIPPFKLIGKKQDGQLNWMGLDSRLSLAGKTVDGGMTVTGINFVGGKSVSLSIGEIKSDYNLHKIDNGMFLGDISFSLPTLSVKEKAKNVLSIDALYFYNTVGMDDGLLNYGLKMSVDKVLKNDKAYGPGHLELTIKNLDGDMAAKLNEQVAQLQQGNSFEKQKMALTMMGELPQLFSKGATFEISRFDMTMPEGVVEGNLMVTLEKGLVSNPFVLLQKVQGKGELRVPVAVMKTVMTQANHVLAPSSADNAGTPQPSADARTEDQVKAMIQSGLLVQKEACYVIQVTYEKGQLLVNGKPFNPAMMQF